MSFTENYLKLRAQREESSANNAGGISPPAPKQDGTSETGGSTFTSRYMELREKRRNMSISERADAKVRSFLDKQAQQNRTAESFLQNAGAGPAVKTSGGYYSRPELGSASERLYGNITALEPVLTEKRAALDTAQTSLLQAETDLKTAQGHLQQAKAAYDADPTNENATYYNQVADAYNLAYDAYGSAFQSHSAAYDAYKPYEDQLIDALAIYQIYSNQQQAAFNEWRGTIRDAETIQMEIDAIDQQIKEQKKAEKAAADAVIPLEEKLPGYVTGNYTNGYNASAYAPGIQAREQSNSQKNVSPEMQRLLAMKELLQEEYDWSIHYHYADMMQAPDFAEKSAYVPSERNANTGSGWENPLYEYINGNQEAGRYLSSLDDTFYFGTAGIGTPGIAATFGLGTSGKQESQSMNQQEISIYNYLYHTQGKQAASDYYDYIQGDLYRRQREGREVLWGAIADKYPALSSVKSWLTSPVKGISYAGQLIDYLDDGKIDENASYNKLVYENNAIRTQVAKKIEESGKWGKVGSFAYQTGMSMADFLLNTALTGNNQALTLTIMGSGAAADTVIAAKDRGLSDGQAFWLGTIAGLAEAGMESINMETVFNPELLKDGIRKYILKNAGAEGLEEVGTDVVNFIADLGISGDQNELKVRADNYMKQGYTEKEAAARALADQAMTMGADFFGGALSGGILSGTTAGIHVNYTKRLGNELGELNLSEEDIQAFIETGLESNPKTASHQLAMEMQAKIDAGETLSNYDLARLYQANIQAVQAEAGLDGMSEPENSPLPALGEETDGEVSAETMRQQAQADYRAGKITEAEFDAIIDEVMHLEELEDGTSVKTFDSHVGINTQTDSINANANGGTRYENAYERTAGPAVAEPAGEIGAKRTDISDGVPIRDAGQGAGIQTGQMASGTRGQGPQANSQAKAVIERQNTAGDLRQRGLINYTSSWVLGIESGTDTENLLVMPEEHYDAEMQQAAQLAKSETGLNVAFTVGEIQVERRGRTWEVRGVHTGQQIVAQCDNTKATAMQLVKHEIFHDKAMKDPGLTQRLKEEIRERFGPQEFDAVMDRYIDELWPLYGPADATAWEEYEGAYNAILEEMLADAYAGINAFGAHAERFTETVRELTPSNTVNKQQKQENGTEEPTGPPVERFSAENTQEKEMDGLTLPSLDDAESSSDSRMDEMDTTNDPSPTREYVKEDVSQETVETGIRKVAHMDPVAQITGEEFAKGEKDLITQVTEFFTELDNRAYNPQLGSIALDRQGVRSDIAHGIGRKKAAAFAAVPDVLARGYVVDYQKNWKGRGYDTAVVAAPVQIGSEEYLMGIVLNRNPPENKFYVHEVMTTENGASPFKTGTRKGDPSGNTPSVFSILDKIRSVKNGSTSQEKFSADDMDASGANGTRESMTAKEREILRGVETRLLNNIRGALSVTKFGDRSYLKSVIQGLSDTYLGSGTIEQQAMDDLFEQAYRQGIVVDRELHDQYEEVRKYLHTVSLTLDPRDRSDIADYPGFVKRMSGKMRIVNEGGLPVDSAWHELNGMAPELFPDSIAHPADQLVRMTKVLNSLRIAEKSLSDYYGPMASTYKKDAKAEFERAVRESIGELRQIRRFEQERQQKLQEAEPAPTTPEEAMEAWAKLKTARKTYEKAMAKNLLTDEDEIAVGELLKGKMLPEHLDKDNPNVKGILAVYEAKQEYERLTKLLAEYRRKVKADIRAEADTYLETANTWKDKSIGLAYSRETMQRNVEDIVPDKKLAKRINERYFEPVRDAEAAAVKMKEGYREAVRKLNLSRKVKKGDLVSEAHAVQLYGEAMDNIRILEKARGRLKHRDGKSLEEWRGVVYKLWQENPGLDKAKIESAVAEMRQIYDELFRKMNEVRVRWGYEPVNYRQGYFPHFQPGDGDGIMAQFGRVLGIDTQVVALPTTINGLTHTFKPGIQWFGNAQERLGFNTAYDAVEGFDRYIEGAASVICQTENIQRLRALASQIRYRTSDEGIRKQVDAIYSNPTLTEEQKNDAISGIYEKGRYTLSNFVVEVDEYTNLLANKKSRRDRTTESDWGRKSYVLLKWLESRVGANMIAGNVTSALTNFIPLTQASAQLSKKAMLQGMWDTLASYKTDDGIIDRSAFLTNRRGSEPLVKMWQQDYGLSDFLLGVLPRKITEKKAFQKTMKSAKKAYAPIKSVTAPTMGWIQEHSNVLMELIDSFTAGSIVRAAYHQNLKQGLSESEAMHQADIFASRVMAERSKGGMPTLFESKNPFSKLFTQFQLEVNNQWSEVFKDIPRSHREKGLGALALVFLQYFFGAWLFNNLYEKWIGRRPAMDPIDILADTVRDFRSDDVSTTDALSNLANNVLEELPFSAALTLAGIETDGGRVPVSSGIPNIPALVNAATNEDWAPEKRWKEAQDELNKLAYVIPPFGGNQVSKIWKGIKAYVEGGSYSVDSDGNDILQYPVYNDESGDFWGLVQAMLLGKSALPEAREWVEDGFDSFSAKQTAIYQDMIDAGVSEREAYDLIDSLRSASETEEASKKETQIGILQNADATDECKAIAFYGLLATDNERILMDSLADAGAQPGVVMDTLIQLRDAAALPATDKKAAQADILIRSALTESEKEIVIRSWLDDQEVNENGNLTNLGKFNLAMKRGITTDEYLQFRATGMDIDKLLEYTAAGFKADEALDLAQAVHELNPLPGEDRVSTLQKWRASVDFSDDVEDQLTALSMIMEPKSLAVWETANNYGVPPVVYVTFQETATQYDTDSNGSYTQAEAKAVIDAEFSHLTTAQKAVLWQWVCYSSGSKKNPYDPTVGQSFIDSRDAAKAAAEE